MEEIKKLTEIDNLSEDELSEVIGGEDSDSSCMCECWITNKNDYS